MPTVITKPVATDLIESKRKVIDMRDKIYLLKPKDYPFLTILNKLGKEQAINPKYEWLEDELFPRMCYLAGDISAGGTTKDDVLVDDGSGTKTADYFRIHDVMNYIADDGTLQNALVTALDIAAGTVNLKLIGSGVFKVTTDGSKVYIVGNAIAEGTGQVDFRATKISPLYNYCQIFKTAVEITGTEAATKLYGGDHKAYLRAKKGEEHALDIERAFLFGQKHIDTSVSGQPRRYTGGVLEYITSNVDSIAALTYTDFLDWCEKIFEYGSDTKLLFSGPTLVKAIQVLGETKLEVTTRNTDYGLDIMRVVSPFGDLDIIRHKLLKDDYAGYSIALDPESILYRYMGDDGRGVRDHRLTLDTVIDEDKVVDEYLTECGLEIREEKKHGLYKITG